MSYSRERRDFLTAGSVAMVGSVVAGAVATSIEAAPLDLTPKGSMSLKALHTALEHAKGRRDYKRVDMILTNPSDWDAQAIATLKAYRAGPKQVWDMVDIEGPWLNLMRNSLNVQVFGYRHPDFQLVSATHGAAHWALYDDYIWDKYKLGTLLKKAPATAGNPFAARPNAAGANPADVEGLKGVYSPAANSIDTLQRRGVIFLACHNAIWEFTGAQIEKGNNPDHLGHEELAAEFTNHLLPDVVLTPGVVGTIVELQNAGFHYIK
ncbi:MAG: transcriptional initiation protein Tat [Alphaproteobacteria bacterium]|nr:transcriptional initiation protein Tat [Alphaproteobacteria bacterium]